MRLRLFILLITLIVAGASRYHAQNVGSDSRDNAYLGKTWSAYGTKTNTTDLQIAAAPGSLQRVYTTMAYCLNTSAATAQAATINAGGTTYAIVNCPPGAKYQEPTFFDPPLPIPANTAVNMTPVAGVSTTYLFAAGTTAR